MLFARHALTQMQVRCSFPFELFKEQGDRRVAAMVGLSHERRWRHRSPSVRENGSKHPLRPAPSATGIACMWQYWGRSDRVCLQPSGEALEDARVRGGVGLVFQDAALFPQRGVQVFRKRSRPRGE